LSDRGSVADTEIPVQLKFEKYLPTGRRNNIPPGWIEKELYLRFTLSNDTDQSRSIGFYPGTYFRRIDIFKGTAETMAGFQPVKHAAPPGQQIDGYKLINFEPFEKSTFVIRLIFIRSSSNVLSPMLLKADYIDKHKAVVLVRRTSIDVTTYIASGMMLMMIIYSLAVYLQNKNDEFLFYALYASCTSILLFLIPFLAMMSSSFNFIYIEYVDLMILCASVFFYLAFMSRFLDTRQKHPFLEKLFKTGHALIIVLMLIYSAIYFFTEKFLILSVLENICKEFFLVIGLVFIIYGIRSKDKLMKYLVAGNFALIFLGLLSLIILISGVTITKNSNWSLLNRPLFYYESGLVIELMLFLSGLAYKNRLDIAERVKERERLKMENERKEFEKQIAVMAAQQEERDRISADMHDELGSGVTAIRLMSEIVKSKMKDQTLPEIDKISNSANELLNKMNTIIWTMKSSNDTLESMIAYIRAHATEYFDGTPIRCTINTPEQIPAVEMSGEKRRNIFLSVKECLNNILKHANATKVSITITTGNNKFILEVADNGIGMDGKGRRFGNGLTNMRRRMEVINGSLNIAREDGTRLRFELDI
jgi:signal transduction histidine kinase